MLAVERVDEEAAVRGRQAGLSERGGRRGPAGVLLAHAVLVQLLTTVLRPATSYRALELDVPMPLLGLLAASFAVVPLVLAVPSGALVDRVGERRVMLAGAVLVVLAAASAVAVGGLAGLLVSSVLLGTGHLLSVVGEQALVANASGPGRYDAAFGRYTFAASLGQTLGPLLLVVGGGQAVPDTRPVFLGATGLAVLLVACTAALRASRPAAAGAQAPAGVGTLLRLPGIARALLTSTVVLAAVDITLVYLPALGADRGLAAGVVGALLAVRAAASMTSRFFLGRLTARHGRRRLLLTSVAASALAMAVAPVPMPLPALAAVVVVLGLGLGVGQPLTMSWLAEVAPPGARGRAMSLRLTGNRLGQVLLPSALGLVAAGAGPAGVLWVTAAALAGVGVAARRLHAPAR